MEVDNHPATLTPFRVRQSGSFEIWGGGWARDWAKWRVYADSDDVDCEQTYVVSDRSFIGVPCPSCDFSWSYEVVSQDSGISKRCRQYQAQGIIPKVGDEFDMGANYDHTDIQFLLPEYGFDLHPIKPANVYYRAPASPWVATTDFYVNYYSEYRIYGSMGRLDWSLDVPQ